MSERTLIKGGYVLSMDPDVGELEDGDVLIEDGKIAAIGPSVEAEDAELVDAKGAVVMPGFVDTHRHTWQTTLRAICADWPLMAYFRGIRQTISPRYTAEDVYVGNYVGALEALSAGVTTILDFSHCNNTPQHGDAALKGLTDAGIRAVFGYGYFPAPSDQAGFADHAARIADARRIKAEYLSSGDGLVTMGIAITETGLLPFEVTREEIESAREMDALVVAHTGCVWGIAVCAGLPEMNMHGLLDEAQVHVHCNCLSSDEFDLLADVGSKVSISPETEIGMGMGHPVFSQCLSRGIKPTLSCDVISLNSGDMFAQMRLGLTFQRGMENDPIHAEGRMPEQFNLTVRDAIGWGTVNGAEALGLGAKTGSLSPGKEADVIIVGSGNELNMTPRPELVGSIVFQANPSNVTDVFVAGRAVKRGGELVGIEMADIRRRADESRERIFATVLADGPILPPNDPEFDAELNTMCEANIARAHEMAVR